MNLEELFVRFGEQEKEALSSFGFLDDETPSSLEDMCNGEEGYLAWKDSHCSGCQEMAGSKSVTVPSVDQEEHEHFVGMQAPVQGYTAKTAVVSKLRTGNHSSTSEPSAKHKILSHSSPLVAQNRTVAALKEAHRKAENRFSNSSFDSTVTFGAEGFCLSDSCCEQFSDSSAEEG